MVVYKNGVYGVNVEHAWADAPITGHMMEEILYNEFSRRKYNSDGSCDADKTRLPFKPEKLRSVQPKTKIISKDPRTARAVRVFQNFVGPVPVQDLEILLDLGPNRSLILVG